MAPSKITLGCNVLSRTFLTHNFIQLEERTMTTNAENAFAYNILMPDLLLFVIALTAVFGLMLLIF